MPIKSSYMKSHMVSIPYTIIHVWCQCELWMREEKVISL